MSFRDDDDAHALRAGTLIDEIAALERARLTHAATDHRLEEARRELLGLQPPAATVPRGPGAVAHVLVFGATAAVAFLGYSLAF